MVCDLNRFKWWKMTMIHLKALHILQVQEEGLLLWSQATLLYKMMVGDHPYQTWSVYQCCKFMLNRFAKMEGVDHGKKLADMNANCYHFCKQFSTHFPWWTYYINEQELVSSVLFDRELLTLLVFCQIFTMLWVDLVLSALFQAREHQNNCVTFLVSCCFSCSEWVLFSLLYCVR